jgi:hypothetical protein
LNPQILDAGERLAQSRLRLRQAMLGVAPTGGGTPRKPAAWWGDLKAAPGAELLIALAQGWWSRHPLRAVAHLVMTVGAGSLQPLARRHPLPLVLGAAVVGGLLVWSRPWRRISGAALLAGLLPQLLAALQSAARPGSR